jgi:hypothetical protein
MPGERSIRPQVAIDPEPHLELVAPGFQMDVGRADLERALPEADRSS